MTILAVDILPYLHSIDHKPRPHARIRLGRLDQAGGLTVFSECRYDPQRGWCALDTGEPVPGAQVFTHWYYARLHLPIRLRAWLASRRRIAASTAKAVETG